MSGRVWVVGSLNIDLVVTVDHHPRPGQTVPGRTVQRSPGGKGANQALAAARAGAPTALVAAVGADGQAAGYLDRLAELGVELHVTTKAGIATGQAVVTVDAAGENTIVVIGGANAELTAADVLPALAVGPGDVLLVQQEVPAATVTAALRQARAAGATTVVNPSPWRDEAGAVGEADVLVVNEDEATALGPPPAGAALVRTLGAAGAEWAGVGRVAAPRIEVVDTTGAGDAFAGTLAAALARGADRLNALVEAVEAGARQCLHAGAQPWHL